MVIKIYYENGETYLFDTKEEGFKDVRLKVTNGEIQIISSKGHKLLGIYLNGKYRVNYFIVEENKTC